ncbi:hypothetical protein [Lentzea sp. NBRC 102530]|uniref:hypothetical protein n=1 Tax=Lentzea sp. NBRC 102530 TaxID=3032201 RepID=UPI0024A53BA6|nr:hypothetical protein [Lentzea sp. NBRC 102530]GLY54871.1 hypothetical protein Lesp01_85260 [Lentzea sp. NBRC 102530]
MNTATQATATDVNVADIVLKLAELVVRASKYDGPASWRTAARIINNHRVEVFFTGPDYREMWYSVSGYGNFLKISFDEAVAAIAT